MKRRAFGSWWDARAAMCQRNISDVMPFATWKAETKPSKPAYAPKPPRPLSSEARTAFEAIQGRLCRAVGLAAYYWADEAMKGVCWIEQRVLKELKGRNLIRRDGHGLYVPTGKLVAA